MEKFGRRPVATINPHDYINQFTQLAHNSHNPIINTTFFVSNVPGKLDVFKTQISIP